jgi:hypothetical protein
LSSEARTGDQRLDGDLALLEVALGALLEFGERGAREVQERLVVAPQRVAESDLNDCSSAARAPRGSRPSLRLAALLVQAHLELARALLERAAVPLRLQQLAAQLLGIALELRRLGSQPHRVLPGGGQLRLELAHPPLGPACLPTAPREPKGEPGSHTEHRDQHHHVDRFHEVDSDTNEAHHVSLE